MVGQAFHFCASWSASLLSATVRDQHHHFADHPEGLRCGITQPVGILPEEILLVLLQILLQTCSDGRRITRGCCPTRTDILLPFQMQSTAQMQPPEEMQNEEPYSISIHEVMGEKRKVIDELQVGMGFLAM